jgi:site-specific recombinase XerD
MSQNRRLSGAEIGAEDGLPIGVVGDRADPVLTPAGPPRGVGLSPAAAAAVRAGVAASTRRAYAGDLARFRAWCAAAGREALPATADTLTEYATHLTYELGRAPATAERALAAIRTAHRAGGRPMPDTLGARSVLRGWADFRARSKDPAHRPRRASPALPDTLRAMLAELDRTSFAGARDAALLLLGFATAARVSELVDVDQDDVAETDEGLDVRLYRGKVRLETIVAVPFGSDPATCPVRAVRAWRAMLAGAGRTGGPLFVRVDRHDRLAVPLTRRGRPIGDPDGRLTGQAAAQVVARAAAGAGLNTKTSHWSGHSLRRGLATAAARRGASALRIARHGGWADGSRALAGYIDDAGRWVDNPLRDIGL